MNRIGQLGAQFGFAAHMAVKLLDHLVLQAIQAPVQQLQQRAVVGAEFQIGEPALNLFRVGHHAPRGQFDVGGAVVARCRTGHLEPSMVAGPTHCRERAASCQDARVTEIKKW